MTQEAEQHEQRRVRGVFRCRIVMSFPTVVKTVVLTVALEAVLSVLATSIDDNCPRLENCLRTLLIIQAVNRILT